MRQSGFGFNQLSFILFLGLCSCSGCDIEVSSVMLNKDAGKTESVDISSGKCLVNDIESTLTPNKELRLNKILKQRLPEIFTDSVFFINDMHSGKAHRNIPFEVTEDILDSLRRSTSFTYLFQMQVNEGETLERNNHIHVVMNIFDLDTRNLVYHQRVSAMEMDPEYDPEATSTFTFGRSSFSMIKRAVNMGLRDLESASEKFKKSTLPNTTKQ